MYINPNIMYMGKSIKRNKHFVLDADKAVM